MTDPELLNLLLAKARRMKRKWREATCFDGNVIGLKIAADLIEQAVADALDERKKQTQIRALYDL